MCVLVCARVCGTCLKNKTTNQQAVEFAPAPPPSVAVSGDNLPLAANSFFAMRFFCCILRSCGTWGIVLCPAWSACAAFNYAAIEKLRRVQQFFVPTLPGFPQGLPLLAVGAVVVATATTKAMTTGFKFVTTTNSDRNNTSSSNSNKLSRTIAKWSTNLITQFYWINSNLAGGGGAAGAEATAWRMAAA